MDVQPQPPVQPSNVSLYIKIIVVIVVCVFIYIKIRPYLGHIVNTIETLRSLINLFLSFSSDVAQTTVNETSIGSKLVVNKLSKPLPQPDMSRNKSGFCYVGEYKGVRSCVKVDKSPCATQVYSTEQQCVNPELR